MGLAALLVGLKIVVVLRKGRRQRQRIERVECESEDDQANSEDEPSADEGGGGGKAATNKAGTGEWLV